MVCQGLMEGAWVTCGDFNMCSFSSEKKETALEEQDKRNNSNT